MKKTKNFFKRKKTKFPILRKLSYSKYVYNAVLIIFCIAVITSCNKDEINESIMMTPGSGPLPGPYPDVDVLTELGAQFSNPWSVDNMTQASINLYDDASEIYNSHNYIRFLPSDLDDLKTLIDDTNLVLFDTPFDYEIITEGTYYQEPNIPEEDITWLYTVVPVNYNLPNVYYEILENLYIPSDIEADLEDEALRITGQLDTTADASGGTKAWRYKPQGYIRVQNSQLGTVGVKKIRVIARRGCKIKRTYTNSSGYFKIEKKFRKARIYVKYKNPRMQLRSIRGIRIWQIAYPLCIKLGKYKKSALQNINEVFGENHDSGITPSRNYFAALTINAVEDMRTYCSQNSISLPPDELRIYITNYLNGSASASMLHKLDNTSLLSSVVDVWLYSSLLGPFEAVKNVVNLYLPDLTFSYNYDDEGDWASDEINRIQFHELGHSCHYAKVGNNWWCTFVNYTITQALLHSGDPYGDGTANNAGYCGIAEAWAENVAFTFCETKYGLHHSQAQTTQAWDIEDNRWIWQLEEWDPDNANNPWIPDGIFHDIWDGEGQSYPDHFEPNAVTDNVIGITMGDAFNFLMSSTESPEDFRDQLINNYSGQAANITTLFTSYGH